MSQDDEGTKGGVGLDLSYDPTKDPFEGLAEVKRTMERWAEIEVAKKKLSVSSMTIFKGLLEVMEMYVKTFQARFLKVKTTNRDIESMVVRAVEMAATRTKEICAEERGEAMGALVGLQEQRLQTVYERLDGEMTKLKEHNDRLSGEIGRIQAGFMVGYEKATSIPGLRGLGEMEGDIRPMGIRVIMTAEGKDGMK